MQEVGGSIPPGSTNAACRPITFNDMTLGRLAEWSHPMRPHRLEA